MKGIILAGGNGTRLYPSSLVVSKQLMNVYDKPLIYYPLSTLMLAGIREILIITNPGQEDQFRKLFSDGSHLGISISYKVQDNPNGLPEAFILAEDFIGDDDVCMILGDNIIFGNDLDNILKQCQDQSGATILSYPVRDPERFGVVEIDSDGKAISLEEKPEKPKTNFAATGLYFYDNNVVDITKDIKPSDRGELEITDVNLEYLKMSKLNVQILGRGFAWLDTGTHQSLLEASSFVKTLEERQGIMISCLEEIAFGKGWIDEEIILERADSMGNSPYSQYLKSLLNQQTKFPWDSK